MTLADRMREAADTLEEAARRYNATHYPSFTSGQPTNYASLRNPGLPNHHETSPGDAGREKEMT
jgi:hypothetical protein